MVLGGSVVGYRPFVYTGPGDIVSGADAWWGLRAYSSATIGNNAIRLRRSSDNAEQDFVTIAGGGLDLASISSFKGAASLFVVSLYDQTGNGNTLTQASAAAQPQFILSGIGALPVLRYTATLFLRTSSIVALLQPFTLSWVAKRTTVTSTAGTVSCVSAVRSGFLNTVNTIFGYAGAVLSVTKTDGNFYAVQSVMNGASSDLNIDGSASTGNMGSSEYGTTGDDFTDTNVDLQLVGDVVEYGCWDVGFTSGQSSSMSTNQHAYWGF